MSGKLNAFLTRAFFKGSKNEVDFKGRDVFDLIWYMGQEVQPNFERLKGLLEGTRYQNHSWEKILNTIGEKLEKIKREYIIIDIQQFIEDKNAVNSFIDNYLQVFEQYYRKYKNR